MTSPSPLRVLVVDDDPAIRHLVCTALRRHGFTVDSAADGLEALARLDAGDYGLLVLDLMMPRLDGFGVLDRIEGTATRRPKILILTAAAPSVLDRLSRERVNAVLTKPFDLSALIAAARTLSADAGDPPAWSR